MRSYEDVGSKSSDADCMLKNFKRLQPTSLLAILPAEGAADATHRAGVGGVGGRGCEGCSGGRAAGITGCEDAASTSTLLLDVTRFEHSAAKRW